MFVNWSKLIFAFIYLTLIIVIIILQLSLLPTWNSVLIGFFLTITAFFTSLLFATSAISAFSQPLTPPNILVALSVTITAVTLFIIQTYLFILAVIDFVTLNFPH